MRSRILLTGVSGFIGQSLVKSLAASGHQVVCLGRSCPDIENVSLAQADISDPASIRSALALLRLTPQFDGLIHLAVSRHHRDFPQKALDLFYVNTAAAAELLQFAHDTGIDRAVFGSTGTVYSSTTDSGDEFSAGNHESEFRKPAHYFAASKLFADEFCNFYRNYFKVSILRFYAPYGPGLKDRMLTDIVSRVEKGMSLSLPATGPGLTFSSVYIDDAVSVIETALAEGWNETVNVASPHVLTIESVGELIGQIVNRAPSYERGPQSSAPRIVPNTNRLVELMPSHVFTAPDVGIRAMIAAGQA